MSDLEAHVAATQDLISLAETGFPVVGPGDHPDIRVYGAALLARVVGSAQAVLTLAPTGREADINILLRSALEHSVTFAWLAAAPDSRFACWQKEDARQRLATANDMQRFGVELLAPEARLVLKRQMAADIPLLPPLPQRAREADAHWAAQVGLSPTELASFGGLYVLVYRRGSSRGHASVFGLNDVVRPAGGQFVVAMESSMGSQPSVRMCCYILGLTLYVAAETLGWPGRVAIDRAFTALAERVLRPST